MRNLTIYLVILLYLFLSKLVAQESFESKAKKIAENIEWITREQKALLKAEVEDVNIQLEKGEITIEQANLKKQKLAQTRATIIENKVSVVQQELKNLVQDKVDGKVQDAKDTRSGGRMIIFGTNSEELRPNQTEFNVSSLKVYNGQEDKDERQSKRTTSQFVFAAGLNNVVTDGEVKKSDFRYLGSHFYEIGVSYNSRLLNNSNLLHAKYGLSVMYNNLRPTDNLSFEVNGNQTNLAVNPIELKDSRFRNVSLVFPLHLEFDFTKPEVKNDKTYFKSHQSVRVGLGGYAGLNLKTKQILQYENSDLKSTEKTKGDFNTSDFVYGLSTYIGYKATSLYLKYDLNPIFKDNAVKQNNVSLGLRFDFN
ncbi:MULTISPECIES: hypothetical protein [unclassified Flavobacterium]|uniref:hypothetical protein n=1 Tax=unclassified Flavobacterium TaxID=196869 RepID=UPI00131B8EB2|nr:MULTISPECIES: hypothetical protein [unclassified Flavobacterium]